MIYGTYQLTNKAWESPAPFDSLHEALEILDFFAKGKPWLISNDPAELKATIAACERQALAEEVEAFLRWTPLDTRVES